MGRKAGTEAALLLEYTLFLLFLPKECHIVVLDFCFGLDSSLHLEKNMNLGYSLCWGKAKEKLCSLVGFFG